MAIRRRKKLMTNKYEQEQIFHEPMEQLGKMHERSKVYVDFMDYYIYQNSQSPQRKLPTGYKEEEMQLFDKAYHSFNDLMKSLIKEHGWYDYIGEYYEEYILAGSKASSKGQFYTPQQISELLSKIVGFDTELCEAYDPACGSARNLLDYHSRHPNVRCTGEDLDESACKMAVINFHCHNVDGVVNWIDALTREYMGVSWKILGGQIYITDLETIRAVDDVMNGVSILSLSDETIHGMMCVVAEVLGNEGSDKEVTLIDSDKQGNTNKKKGVLDDWL